MSAEVSLSPAAIDAMAEDIAEMAAHIDAATHRLLVAIREFDLAGGWHHQGALSCAHWLSWRIGLGLGPASEKVRVAHKLAELPLFDDAFRRGELSYSKLRAMTRVATSSNEAELLDLARCSTAAQLERICRFYTQARRQQRKDHRLEDERRWVVSRATEDGMVSIQIRLLPDEAARLMRAVEVAADHSSLADGAVAMADIVLSGSRVPDRSLAGDGSSSDDADRHPVGATAVGATAVGATAVGERAVGKTAVGETAIDETGVGETAVGETAVGVRAVGATAVGVRAVGETAVGETVVGATAVGETAVGETAVGETAVGARPGRAPVEVVVHITAANLEGTTEVGDGLSSETCRRLLCDAGVVPMLEDASGKTIDVGRKTRTIPAALDRALRARDRTCRFPGCSNRWSLDAHHIRHWIDGGETKLANLFRCCRRHHRYLHEYGFSVEFRDDQLVFLTPEGRVIPPVPVRAPLPHAAVDRLRAQNLERGIQISAESNTPGWDGWPVDYDACVAAIGGWNEFRVS
jgi:Domain of unknown function (DUF222)